MSVLGACLLGDRGAIERAIQALTPEDFYRDVHAHIFRTMEEMAARDEPVDPVTLKDALMARGLLGQVGGVGFLLQLGEIEFTTANVEYYAAIVKRKARLRRLAESAALLYREAMSDPEEADALLEEAERQMMAIRETGGAGSAKDFRQLAPEAIDVIEARGKRDGGITGLETPFDALNWYTGGLQDGNFIVLAARPSVGKTALACDLVRHAVRRGNSVLMFALEMSAEEMTLRLLGAESAIDGHAVRTGQLSDADWPRLTEGMERLWDGRLLIDDTTSATPMYLRSVARRRKAECGLSLIVVDYLQLMDGGNERRSENRNLEISYISRSLKLMAKEFQVPLIALSQLSRAVERRENKRPMLSDLRDSGSLEQDADIVMMLHRENYQAEPTGETAEAPGQDPAAPEPAELIIRKQRNGPTGTVNLHFHGKYARFAGVATDRELGAF